MTRTIFTEAETTVLKVLDDQYYCTISSEGANIRISTETYVNDLSEEYTKVLQTNRNEEVYESYTYGITQLKTERREEEHYHVVNGKLDIIGSISESVSTWYDYGVSGNVLTDAAPRFGYSSESHEGSLQYLRARYYDTETGIFLSQDSYRGTVTNQLSQNRYIYTENNAVNRIDPSGNFFNTATSMFMGLGVPKIAQTALSIMTKGVNNIASKAAKSLKSMGQMLLGVNNNETSLIDQLMDSIKEMQASGASEEEIKKANLELIRKYCEIYNLDHTDFGLSKTFQEKIVDDLEKRSNYFGNEYLGIGFNPSELDYLGWGIDVLNIGKTGYNTYKYGYSVAKTGDYVRILGAHTKPALDDGINGTYYAVKNLDKYPNVSKYVQTKGAIQDAFNVRSLGGVINIGLLTAEVLVGIQENIDNGASKSDTVSDAGVDTAFGVGGIMASAASAAWVGGLAGSSFPILGNIIGAVGGFLGGLAYYVATEEVMIYGKSLKEWAKELGRKIADELEEPLIDSLKIIPVPCGLGCRLFIP